MVLAHFFQSKGINIVELDDDLVFFIISLTQQTGTKKT